MTSRKGNKRTPGLVRTRFLATTSKRIADAVPRGAAVNTACSN
jgi:hypothetical protein